MCLIFDRVFIWRTSCVQFLASSTNVDWLLVDYSVEVQLMLLVKRFLFIFPPEASALFSIGRLSYGGFYYLKGEAKLPPSTPNTFHVQFPRVARGALRPLHKIILAKQKVVEQTQKTRLVSPQPAFYITDFVRSTIWLHSPTWIDSTNFINQVQLKLFSSRFLF